MESRSNIRLNEKIESFLKVETDTLCHDGYIEAPFGLEVFKKFKKIESFLKVETEPGYHDGNIETSFGLGCGEAVGSGSYVTSDFVHYDYFGFGNGHYINEIYNYYLDSDNWGSYSGSGGCSNEGKGMGCGSACGYCCEDGYGYGGTVIYGGSNVKEYKSRGIEYKNCGIKSYNGHKVYQIDDIPTIIYDVVRDFASAAIINRDKTLKKCFVVKMGNCFSHGNTLKEAYQDAMAKHLRSTSVEEKIDMFIKEHPSLDSEHSFDDFFYWHNILTGSCLLGRKQFCKEHEIDSNKNYTVRYFLELTKDAYGGDVIKSLMNKY